WGVVVVALAGVGGLVVTRVLEAGVRVGLVEVAVGVEQGVGVGVVGVFEQQPGGGGAVVDRIHDVAVTLGGLIGFRGQRQREGFVEHRGSRPHRQFGHALVAAAGDVLVEADEQR